MLGEFAGRLSLGAEGHGVFEELDILQLGPGRVFQDGVAIFDAVDQDLLGQRSADLSQGADSGQLHLIVVIVE